MASLRNHEKLSTPLAPAIPNMQPFDASAPPLKMPPASRSNNSAYCLVSVASGMIVAADPTLVAMLPSGKKDLFTISISEFIPSLKVDEAGKLTNINLHEHQLFHANIRCQDTSEIPSEINITPLSGCQESYLLISIQTLDSLSVDANHCDALTGLPDRRALQPHRERWCQNSTENCCPHALLFLDLNNFKSINDQFGHTAGDQFLITLASRWQNCIRNSDLLVRYGGDEFVLLIADIEQYAEVEPIIARLLESTNEPVNIGNQSFRIGATIGVALANDTTVALDQLIGQADHDMYRQKRAHDNNS